MTTPEDIYKSLMLIKSIKGIATDDALSYIADLMNLFGDLKSDIRKGEALERAIILLEELKQRELNSVQKVKCYNYLGNAWDLKGRLKRSLENKHWGWSLDETENAIFNFRKALTIELPSDADYFLIDVLTRLASIMHHVGRYIEALDLWDRALNISEKIREVLPGSALPLANKGEGLHHYAYNIKYDYQTSAVLFKYAHQYLSLAINSPALHDYEKKAYNRFKLEIEERFKRNNLTVDDVKELDEISLSLGRSKAEKEYRQWCLENKLFLNPFNDIGYFSVATRDSVSVPLVDSNSEPRNLFNLLIQEYISARYLYFEGISSNKLHFSDKRVRIFKASEYALYSLEIEKIKVAFKTTYSLFHRIAFILDFFLELKIPKNKLNFRSLWFKKKRNGTLKKPLELREEFKQRENWSFCGLFWLSKDLFEKRDNFIEVIEPDAKKLYDIRNELEHGYVKVLDDSGIGELKIKSNGAQALLIHRKDMENKTLKLIKLARSAIMYLAEGILNEFHRSKPLSKVDTT
jgi:tetratricopeptide (TPR) repeat protein